MDFKLIWSNRAIADLGRITKRIAKGDPLAPSKLLPDSDAAKQFGRDIFTAVERLTSFPKTGRRYGDNEAGPIYEIPCRRYRIFYQIFDEAGHVVLLHVRADERGEPEF